MAAVPYSLSQPSPSQGNTTLFFALRALNNGIVQQLPIIPPSSSVARKIVYIKPHIQERTIVMIRTKTPVSISMRDRKRPRLILFLWRCARTPGLLIGPQSTLSDPLGYHAFTRVWKLSAPLLFHLRLSMHLSLKTRHVCPPWRFRNYPITAVRR